MGREGSVGVGRGCRSVRGRDNKCKKRSERNSLEVNGKGM